MKKLVNAIQSDYGVKDGNVVRHYDASHKLCPAPYCGTDKKDKKWKELWKTITSSTTSNPTSTKKEDKSYKVKITCDSLNIRSGPGTKYGIVGRTAKRVSYTIVESKDGWGKLKSGSGWISLKYTKKI